MSRLAFADLLLRDPAALVIVKATVVLALASGAAAAAKGFSAARRHMLWLVALSSCAFLALSLPVAPAIRIHMPILARNAVTTATPATVGALPSAGGAPMASASRVRTRLPSTEVLRRPSVESILVPNHPLIAIWIIGCVVLLVRHAIGFAAATRPARRASVASDGETTRELAGAAAAVGVRRHIVLGYCTDVESPITFGIVKPFVLLPAEAASWSAVRRRAVLLHEVAHVSRADCLSQAIGRFACALFWFHPLVWRAFAHLRADAERAADDCVLRSGMSAFEYATHLLELARRTLDARPNLVAIGIVSTTHLERRFLAMFDTKRSRAGVTSRAQTLTATLALAMICPLASLRIAAPAPPQHALVERTALQHASLPQPASVSRAATSDVDASRIPPAVNVHAAIVPQRASEISLRPIVVVADPTPSAIVHPNFSGKWTSDTLAVRTQEFEFVVTDSETIKQTDDAISAEGRGHIMMAQTHNLLQTHNLFQTVTFDGARSAGISVTGNRATNVVADAVWEGDTLVITTHFDGGGRVFHTIERMTLSQDGKTISVTNASFVDGQDRWGAGPQTIVLRRMAP